MSKKKYLPAIVAQLLLWLQNFSTKLAAHGPALGLSGPEITSGQTACTNLTNAINNTAATKLAFKAAAANQRTVKADVLANVFTGLVAKMKLSPNLTEALALEIGIQGADSGFNPDTFASEISGKHKPEGAEIKFTKGEWEGVRVYSRLKGALDWQFLAIDLHSPYIDNRPVPPVGGGEIREYKVMGWMDDHEVGQMSNIITVTVAS